MMTTAQVTLDHDDDKSVYSSKDVGDGHESGDGGDIVPPHPKYPQVPIFQLPLSPKI